VQQLKKRKVIFLILKKNVRVVSQAS